MKDSGGILFKAGWMRRTFDSLAVVAIVFGVISGALVLGARAAGWLQWAELYAYDIMVRLYADEIAPTEKVVLVGAQEPDLQNYGWPLNDQILHDLIVKIMEGKPRAIGIDIYRDRPIEPGGAALRRLLQENPEIVWIEKFQSETSPGIPPPDVLRGTDQVGFADIIPDDDGVVRRGLLYLSAGDVVSQAFPLALSMRYLAAEDIYPLPSQIDERYMALGDADFIPLVSDFGGYAGADAGGYQYMITYGLPQRLDNILPLGDVLTGGIPVSRFTDAVVIVGTTAESVKDQFLTPFDRGGGIAGGTFGIAVHGAMVEQLIRLGTGTGKSLISALPAVWEYIYILVSALIGALLTWFTRQWLPAAGFILATLAGHIVLAVAAFYMFLWLPVVAAVLATGLAFSASLIHFAGVERRQRRALDSLFSRMVAPAVAQEIWEHRDEFLDGGLPEPREQTASVLFSDIVGFTGVSESMSAARVMDWLELYIARMADIVAEHQGVVDKFIGDAVMAVYGIPVARTDDAAVARDAQNAVACAKAMHAALPQLNAEFSARDLPKVRIRVGIHTGPLVVGGLGSAGRMQYTVIGDTVNVAARLEGYPKKAKENGIPFTESDCVIMVSGVTAKYLRSGENIVEIGTDILSGKNESITIYQVL